jgi:hypothetical protein
MHSFSAVFRHKLAVGKWRKKIASRESVEGLERRLYNMGVQEQAIVKRILDMAGDMVRVQQDTFAIDNKNKPHYLDKEQQVRISKNPVTFDPAGNARIHIIDESNTHLCMRLSDYVQDIDS